MNTSTILPVLQTILAFGNICVLGYALMKFLNKPHNTLEDKVNDHETQIREIKQSLHQGNDRFREDEERLETHEETFGVILHALLALIEFEIQYCYEEKKPITEELKRAKDDLHSYLSQHHKKK